MTMQVPDCRWVLTVPLAAISGQDKIACAGAVDGPDLLLREPAGAALESLWQAVDDSMLRAYAVCADRPGPSWQQLQPVQELAGASAGQAAPFHYAVETDVLPEQASLLDDWYAQEHLPGLAAVPGTVRAARYLRLQGAPKSYACYDLTSLDALRSEPWLAVRHTDWSSRVRPLFRNTVRTGFRRLS